MTRLILQHWPIIALASIVGFNAGLLAVRWWHYWIWKRSDRALLSSASRLAQQKPRRER